MADEIRVLIADDHRIFRRGLRQILEKEPQFRVVGEAEDGEMALRLIPACGADVAILDIGMPNKDGFDVLRAIRQQHWPIKVIFLTMYKDQRFQHAARDLGVAAYLLKDDALSEIVHCIKVVVSDGAQSQSPQRT